MKIWQLPGFPNCKCRRESWGPMELYKVPINDGVSGWDVEADNWVSHEEPKAKKKVTLYRKKTNKGWTEWSTSETSLLPIQFFQREIAEIQMRVVEVEE